MFAVIYRWKVDPALEADFLRIWRKRTIKIQQYLGSHGSRLFKEDDGSYVAIALWPDRQSWEHPSSKLPDDDEDKELFQRAVIDASPAQTLMLVDDLWER